MPNQLISSYFTSLLATAELPADNHSSMDASELGEYLKLYKFACLSRAIDVVEQNITNQGEAFFHVSSAGHEAMACLNTYLRKSDYLYCHYRDRALLLARGMPVQSFFHALYANDASPSRGRQMNAHLHDSSLNILSMVGPVGNHALHSVGLAIESRYRPENPLVLCTMGDGTSQQGEVLEAIAGAVREKLRILFVVEDNGLSISTRTRNQTFFSRPDGQAMDYYGIELNYLDGTDLLSCSQSFSGLVQSVRECSMPAIAVLRVPRLFAHTNSDNQLEYRSQEEIDQQHKNDPLVKFSRLLLNYVDKSILNNLHDEIVLEIETANRLARKTAAPNTKQDTYSQTSLIDSNKNEVDRLTDSKQPLTMNEAIREALKENMLVDESISLYGEDIEDPKGDVFGLTKGLSTFFPKRVNNSPLAEASIVGVSIGRALAGGRPIAFLQFADFLPLAFNQISTELATMDWRTDGQWPCPVLIMVACGGYRAGLGPFHSQTLESILCHIPGLQVMMPANASDAAGLLNAALQSRRPTVFLYPVSCLNDKSLSTSGENISLQYSIPGKARLTLSGDILTFVSWGNGVALCLWAANELQKAGSHCEVIDLRSLAPWDKQSVFRSVEKTGRLIVVHEDTITCGMGAEIISTTTASIGKHIQVARVARPETFVPFNFANQIEILPSRRKVLDAACKMLDLEVDWKLQPSSSKNDTTTINAISHSPSDESVMVAEWLIQKGESVQQGQTIAYLDSDKTISEMVSPHTGNVVELLVAEGDSVAVGSPLVEIQLTGSTDRQAAVTRDEPATPVISGLNKQAYSGVHLSREMFLSGISTVTGSQLVENQTLSERWNGISASDIYQRTGIRQRHYISNEDDTVQTMAITAVQKLLQQTGLSINDVDLIICSTSTPAQTTPSLACSILAHISDGNGDCTAYDINAACSGYIYGLQAAYDYLQGQNGGNVILVTSEVLSPLLDPMDFDTAIIFGDAATATLLTTSLPNTGKAFRVKRPLTSAIGDYPANLFVPSSQFDDKNISMNGKKVFSAGVKNMSHILNEACQKYAVDYGQLNYIIPHQANQRIMTAIAKRLGVSESTVLSNINNHGNTSSSSIPLCIADSWNQLKSNDQVGLTAFGGGYTYGATIIECL